VTILRALENDWLQALHSTKLSREHMPVASSATDLTDTIAVSQPVLVHAESSPDVRVAEMVWDTYSVVYIAFAVPEHVFILDLQIKVRLAHDIAVRCRALC
jgi:hypothetical protein